MLMAHMSTNAWATRDFLGAKYELICIRHEYSGDAGASDKAPDSRARKRNSLTAHLNCFSGYANL